MLFKLLIPRSGRFKDYYETQVCKRLHSTSKIIFGADQGLGEFIRNSNFASTNPAVGLVFFGNSTELMRINPQSQNVGIEI